MTDETATDAQPEPQLEEEEKAEEEQPEKEKVAHAQDTPVAGKRERKKATELYKVEAKSKEEFVVKQGKGTKLADIPNVHYKLSKIRADDELLSALHHLLYKRPGTSHTRKKNILQFSGFVFEGDEAKEKEKVEERVGRWMLPLLHQLMDVFELPRGSGEEAKKESKVDRVVNFLLAPKKLSDKDIAAEEEEKKAKAKEKREKAAAKKEKKAAVRKVKKEKEEKKQTGKRKAEGAKEKPPKKAKKEPVEDVEEEQDEEEPPAKKQKKVEKETKPKKEKKPKKAAADEEDEDDEAPLGKVAEEAKIPSDTDLKAAVLEILKDVDVNNFNMKQLMTNLKAKYKADLSSKKAFIKEIAIDFCQQHAEKADDAPTGDNAPAAEEAPAAE